MTYHRHDPRWVCHLRKYYGSGDVYENPKYTFRSQDGQRTLLWMKSIYESMGVKIEFDGLVCLDK